MMRRKKNSQKVQNSNATLSLSHRINFFKVIYWFFCLLFLGILVYIFLFSGFLRAKKLHFSQTQEMDIRKIEEKTNVFLEEKYWQLIPQNNIFLIWENSLGQKLYQEFGLIRKIKFLRKFPDQLTILIEERHPVLLWENSRGRFILDKEGVAYPENFFDSSGFNKDQLSIIKEEESQSEMDYFQQNNGRNYLNFILEAKDKFLGRLDMEIKKDISTTRIISNDVFFETVDGWKIYLNQQVGVEKSLEMLQIVLAEKIPAEKRKDLEYIDLRLDNKVYYRFKNRQEEEPLAKEDSLEKKTKASQLTVPKKDKD